MRNKLNSNVLTFSHLGIQNYNLIKKRESLKSFRYFHSIILTNAFKLSLIKEFKQKFDSYQLVD